MLEVIEQKVREILATETSAIVLSDKLFSPGGLFSQVGKTQDERRAIVQTPLFQDAQARLSELQEIEADRFAQVVQQLRQSMPERDLSLTVERTKAT